MQASQEMDKFAKVAGSKKFIALKVAVKTRWWAVLNMLDSIFANEETFSVMVKLGKAPPPVKKLNRPKMKLIADAARMLEGEKNSIGGLVEGTICYLRKTLVKMQQHDESI